MTGFGSLIDLSLLLPAQVRECMGRNDRPGGPGTGGPGLPRPLSGLTPPQGGAQPPFLSLDTWTCLLLNFHVVGEDPRTRSSADADAHSGRLFLLLRRQAAGSWLPRVIVHQTALQCLFDFILHDYLSIFFFKI